jgi:hypothetical protein
VAGENQKQALPSFSPRDTPTLALTPSPSHTVRYSCKFYFFPCVIGSFFGPSYVHRALLVTFSCRFPLLEIKFADVSLHIAVRRWGGAGLWRRILGPKVVVNSEEANEIMWTKFCAKKMWLRSFVTLTDSYWCNFCSHEDIHRH